MVSGFLFLCPYGPDWGSLTEVIPPSLLFGKTVGRISLVRLPLSMPQVHRKTGEA